MIPIFVISLKEAKERRAQITKILSSLNLEFSFVDAIDGRNFDMASHNHYNKFKRRLYFGRDLKGAELGCALSHKKIYEKILADKIEKALILEDDVIFFDGFLETFNLLKSSSFEYDLIRFLGRPKILKFKKRKIIELKNGSSICRLCSAPGGAYAYIITKNGAQKLIPHLNKIIYPIDALMGRCWETKLKAFVMMPLLAYVDADAGSYIGDERFDKTLQIKGFQKFSFPLTRCWFKFTETLGKKYWYYTTYFKDKKHGNL